MQQYAAYFTSRHKKRSGFAGAYLDEPLINVDTCSILEREPYLKGFLFTYIRRAKCVVQSVEF